MEVEGIRVPGFEGWGWSRSWGASDVVHAGCAGTSMLAWIRGALTNSALTKERRGATALLPRRAVVPRRSYQRASLDQQMELGTVGWVLGGANRPRLVEVPMVVRRPPMMHAKLNGIRNVEGENPLGKGSEGSGSIVREHCQGALGEPSVSGPRAARSQRAA